MSAVYDNRFLPFLLVSVVGVSVGTAAASGELTLVIAVGLTGLALCALLAPPTYWVLAAVTSAVLFPGLEAGGLAPGFAPYLHFPLVLGGFITASIRYSGGSRLAQILLAVLGVLLLSCGLSTLFDQASPVRGLFSFVLLAEPILLLTTLAMAPPSLSRWKSIRWTLLALILIQIPIAYFQVASVGPSSLLNSHLADRVTGTFGVVGGQDVLAAIAVIGGVWLLAMPRGPFRLAGVVALFALPFLAFANKVILTLPAIIVALPGSRLRAPVRIVIGVASLAVVLAFSSLLPAYLVPSLESGLSSDSGKRLAMNVVWNDIKGSPSTLAFGAGPATTVSGAAYLSTDPLRKPSSPIRYLGIEPAQTAINLGALEKATSSFNRPRSSAIGILGDLGLLGFFAYCFYLAYVLKALYAKRSPEASAAVAGMLFVIIFGLLTTGWELPTLTVFVAAMAGLALVHPPKPG